MKKTEEEKISEVISSINQKNPEKQISFEYDVEPLPYARPRKGKYGAFYNPRQKYKNSLRKLFQNDIDELIESTNMLFPIEGEICIEMIFGLVSTESIKKSKLKTLLAKLNIIKPIVRPDIDNYIKPILDAYNGILFVDDGQIYKIIASKEYSLDKPYIKINVTYREQKIKLR